MAYNWDFGFLWTYRWLVLSGLGYTILYAIGTVILGQALGLAIGLTRFAGGTLVNVPTTLFVQLFRCTPVLVQLVWFYYAFPIIIGVELSAPVAGVMALTLYASAFYAEIFRGGIQAVDRGQWEAARAIGMRNTAIFRRIVLPQAVTIMLPSIINQMIMQLKNTSLLSTIAVAELLYQGAVMTADTYKPLEVYSFIAIVYFIVLFPLTLFAEAMEKKFRSEKG